ncbi:FAD-dependent oxidoreductase [Rhizobium leguminosarum]|uniref:FAD-dependent oxidoreductase n=1 Tax=Rhizobium leguminosarum TaxID=384 RepID=UPI001C93F601|nr:FAD-dependent oxidoreductase [Rhizobium leguminosarum]MBY5551079.1 FAD-dependent oxidoreductase [Rhizobium leguminosarum]
MNFLDLFRRKRQPGEMKPATEQVARIVAEANASPRPLLPLGTGQSVAKEEGHGKH